MTDITEEQQAAAERIITEGLAKVIMPSVGPALSDILASTTSSLDSDTSIVIAYAINTYLETINRMGGRAKLTAQDVTRLFTIINLYLEGGAARVGKPQDFAPRGKPTR